MTLLQTSLRRTSSPSGLAVTVAEVKQALKLASSDSSPDDQLSEWIPAATERLERDINKKILTATYELKTCSWGNYLPLKIRPITAVTSVQYIDPDGDTQTLDTADWRWDQARGVLLPALGENFPEVYDDPNAITVTMTAGYGADGSCIPRLMKVAICLGVGKWFFDPAQESSALHAAEVAYSRIVQNLKSGIYP